MHDAAPEPIGRIAARIVQRLSLRRKLEQLHERGPRATVEFFADLVARFRVEGEAERRLDAFLALDDRALDVTGGREMPVVPLRVVRDE